MGEMTADEIRREIEDVTATLRDVAKELELMDPAEHGGAEHVHWLNEHSYWREQLIRLRQLLDDAEPPVYEPEYLIW